MTEHTTVLVRMSEELVNVLSQNGWDFGVAGDDGFYSPTVTTVYSPEAERRATVERIRTEIGPGYEDDHMCQYRLDLAGLRAILDEEAARNEG